MKIDLKLSADEVNYLEKKLIIIQAMKFRELDNQSKTTYTILIDVLDKVMVKTKSISRKIDLFDNSKRHKVSLKFHEADRLKPYIEAFSQTETDLYLCNLARKIVAQLDQKLA